MTSSPWLRSTCLQPAPPCSPSSRVSGGARRRSSRSWQAGGSPCTRSGRARPPPGSSPACRRESTGSWAPSPRSEPGWWAKRSGRRPRPARPQNPTGPSRARAASPPTSTPRWTSSVSERVSERPGSSVSARVIAFDAAGSRSRSDRLATEEPLEIRLLAGRSRRTASVTMRTPGADFELAAGFLHGEGIVAGPGDIVGMSYCSDPGIEGEQRFNIVNVALAPHVAPDLAPLERHFLTTSACGVCGKASLDALRVRSAPLAGTSPRIDPGTLTGLPGRLRAAQGLFEVTGGLHAAGLFDAGGNLVAVRQDVARHSAVDKLLGRAPMAGRMP